MVEYLEKNMRAIRVPGCPVIPINSITKGEGDNPHLEFLICIIRSYEGWKAIKKIYEIDEEILNLFE